MKVYKRYLTHNYGPWANAEGAPAPGVDPTSASPVGAIIQSATALIGAVSQIIDDTKRRNVEMALANLSADQQMQLNAQIAAAGTQTDRLNVLAQAVATVRSAQSTALINQSTEADKLKILLWLGIGGLVLGAGTLIFFAIKKK